MNANDRSRTDRIKAWFEWIKGVVENARFQQTVLCLLLLGGLGAFFFTALSLRVK